MGDQERFERLYRDHAGRVKAYALRRVGSAAAADEIVSDVFLVVWRRLGEVPGDALPWLLGVARNAVANRQRGVRRTTALRARISESGATPSAEDTAADAVLEGSAPVIRALAQLSERDRELLMLVAWEGLEPAQLAQVLGVSRGTVNVRLHRARRRLAAAMASGHLQQLKEATK